MNNNPLFAFMITMLTVQIIVCIWFTLLFPEQMGHLLKRIDNGRYEQTEIIQN